MGRRIEGQSLVEFSLVLPLLVAMLLFMVQVGVLIEAKLVLSDAARAGAREASITDCNVVAAKDMVEDDLALGGLDNSLSDTSVNCRSNYVVVGVTYWQPVFVPGIDRLLGSTGGPSPLSSAAIPIDTQIKFRRQ